MNIYKVTLHRVVELETTFKVKADNEEEAEASVLSGYYEEIVNDSEIGELEDPEVTNIEEV